MTTAAGSPFEYREPSYARARVSASRRLGVSASGSDRHASVVASRRSWRSGRSGRRTGPVSRLVRTASLGGATARRVVAAVVRSVAAERSAAPVGVGGRLSGTSLSVTPPGQPDRGGSSRRPGDVGVSSAAGVGHGRVVRSVVTDRSAAPSSRTAPPLRRRCPGRVGVQACRSCRSTSTRLVGALSSGTHARPRRLSSALVGVPSPSVPPRIGDRSPNVSGCKLVRCVTFRRTCSAPAVAAGLYSWVSRWREKP